MWLIRNWIAELIREASELEVVYEESQKKFTWVLKQVEEEVGKYLKTQSTADSTVFMDESFDNLWWYSKLVQHLTLSSSCGGHSGHTSCLADFPAGERVSLSLEDIPLAA